MSTLLEDINRSIKRAGGRLEMAKAIMDENPRSFTYFEHKKIRERLNDSRHRSAKPGINKLWSYEQCIFLVRHYGLIKTSEIVKAIGRSSDACRQKFFRMGGVRI